MPNLERGLRYATAAVVLFLIVSAMAFFIAGPGFSWFFFPPAPSPTAAPSPSPSPVHEIPIPSVEATVEPTPANASNAANETLSPEPSPTPSPPPVQVVEINASASTPPRPFGLPFSRSSFPVFRRSEFPTAVALRFGDLDADGNLELFFFQGALSVQAYLSTGKRVWGWDNPPFENLAGIRQAPGVVWDFDRNGRPEVVFFKAEVNKTFIVVADAANGNEKNKLELNFSKPTHLAVAPGDFSKSGWKSDLVVLARSASQQKLFFYDFSFNKLGEYAAASGKPLGFSVAALDANGDGRDEAIVSGAAVQQNGSVSWSHGGSYASSEAEEITLVDLQGDAGKEIVFSHGKEGLLAVDKAGKEVWSSSLSRVVHASEAKTVSSNHLAAVLEVREPSLEQGLIVFSPGGGQAWALARKPVSFTGRPFDCRFSAAPNLFFAGRFYEALLGNSSLEEFGRGLACADLSGDGREELVSLREEPVAGAYLDVYTNPVAQQPAVARRNSELDYLLEKGTLGVTRG